MEVLKEGTPYRLFLHNAGLLKNIFETETQLLIKFTFKKMNLLLLPAVGSVWLIILIKRCKNIVKADFDLLNISPSSYYSHPWSGLLSKIVCTCCFFYIHPLLVNPLWLGICSPGTKTVTINPVETFQSSSYMPFQYYFS